MIRGLGIDVIEVSRIVTADQSHAGFAARICTPRELEYCRLDPTGQRLAGRFAAKEAVSKALGRSFSWHDVEVLPDSRGGPVVHLRGGAARHVAGDPVLVTISHTHQLAAAAAVWTDG